VKVLILGGYGVFGGRLAQLLSNEPCLTLVIAGRSMGKAQAFCARLGGAASAMPAEVDRSAIDPALRRIRPDILVDATGPFQGYGGRPYAVVEACIRNGVHYLDLADGADFVSGIRSLDGDAVKANVWALAGVSSFPVLTVAVTEELARDLDAVHAVTGGIAPSPYAGVGPNVIRAITGYAGQPLGLRRGGRGATAHALTESMDYTVAPPGETPLRTLRFSLVDVPDLRVLPERIPELADVWMGAGPVPEVLHRALNGLSWLVRLRILPSLLFLAPVVGWVSNHVRWGEHRGGMFVRVTGTRGGSTVERSWHLLAEGDDGPLIPSMAVEAIVRNALDGRMPAPGARPASGELTLADYEGLFSGRSIRTGSRRSEDDDPRVPLYRRLLGRRMEDLPDPVRRFHEAPEGTVFAGEATVRRGAGVLAALAGWLGGFPTAGRAVRLTVALTRSNGRETWVRDYAGHVMTSEQSEGSGRWSRLLVERFGAIRIGMATVVEDGRLRLVVRRWSFAGIPLPLSLAPGGDVSETASDGAFAFHVEVRSPMTGMIVTYEGRLRETPPPQG
jgi:hypothetical protein